MNADRRLLYFALALPLLFTLVVSAIVLGPRLLSKSPAYGFLYATNLNAYAGPYSLKVIEGTLRRVERTCASPCHGHEQAPRLFVYDVKTRRSTEVSLEEAYRLKLDPSQESPDGYRIERGGYSGGGFLLPFGSGRYDQNTYLVGPAGRFKLNLATPNAFFDSPYSYGYFNTQLIGWITSQEQ